MVRTAKCIEELLRWAYRDELSKRTTSSAEDIWDRILDNSQHGCVDTGHGSAQRYPQFGLPHPDAERIECAVGQIEDIHIDWDTEATAIMGDLIALVDPRSPRLHRADHAPRRSVAGWQDLATGHRRSEVVHGPRDVVMVRALRSAALVTMHAKMGTRPDWREDVPSPMPVAAERGRGVAIVGECKGHNLYSTGSYCPLRWSPSPLAIAEARADYLAWWRGLRRLSVVLVLSDFEVLPPSAPEMPWRDREDEPPVVHAPVWPHRPKRLPLKPARKVAGPRQRRPRASEVRKS